MTARRQPSRGITLLARDVVSELHRCGKPIESDDWAHLGILMSHQLAGVVRYCLRCEPVRAADAVHAHRWNDGLLHLIASHPEQRSAELSRLLVLANDGQAPKEGTS